MAARCVCMCTCCVCVARLCLCARVYLLCVCVRMCTCCVCMCVCVVHARNGGSMWRKNLSTVPFPAPGPYIHSFMCFFGYTTICMCVPWNLCIVCNYIAHI
jgi:hypothetical protein